MKLCDSWAGQKILITGGLGFIGSNLALNLVDSGAKVTIIDKLDENYGGNPFNIQNIKDKTEVYLADLNEKDVIEKLVRDKNTIFNLAGSVSHTDSMKNPLADAQCNFTSHITLLEACREFGDKAKMVFASTRQIYGRSKYLPIDEMHVVEPADINGINKLACEKLHMLYNKIYGMDVCSLRLTNTFGPRQLMKHGRQGFIPWFIRQAIDNQKIKIFGTGEQKRDINYVSDVVDAFLLAAEKKVSFGKIYNLGGEITSLLNFTKMLVETAKSGSFELVPFPEERAKIDVGDAYSDYSKIKNDLGWQPQVSIEQGLRETIDYYRLHKSNYW